ncbi:hexose kinase [Pseudokineococcus basanitobsidens]|uniref:Hexose kinase n=1 Tax=Pseudokineococcus basanitobsidens TaxID=1926649 RepID=A0ABU8RP02_9ACTN
MTPNPAVDVTYRVARQVVGETVRVQEVRRRAGGKGVNVARVLRLLAEDVVAVHPLGGAAGAWVAAQLAQDGLPAESVDVAGETRTTVAVADGASHPTLYAEPGPVLGEDDWERLVDAAARSCAPDAVLVVAGSTPPGVAPDAVADLVRAGRRAGALVVVDTSGPGLVAAARAGADVLRPNAAEAVAAVGADDLRGALDALLGLGAGRLVVSRGSEGLVAVDRAGGRWQQAAVPDVEGDPTGAGDAATAGYVAALAAGAGTPEALLRAALCGAAAVLQPVAGALDLDDLPVLERRLRAAAAPGGEAARPPSADRSPQERPT